MNPAPAPPPRRGPKGRRAYRSSVSLSPDVASRVAEEAAARGITQSLRMAELIEFALRGEHTVAGVGLPSIEDLTNLDERWGSFEVTVHRDGLQIRSTLAGQITRAERALEALDEARQTAEETMAAERGGADIDSPPAVCDYYGALAAARREQARLVEVLKLAVGIELDLQFRKFMDDEAQARKRRDALPNEPE